MALDYLISLELWLSPFSVIGRRHKSIFVQQLASIYEALLEVLLDHEIHKVKDGKPILNKQTLDRRPNTIGVLVKKFRHTDIFTEGQLDYLKKVADFRNLVHLNRRETQEIRDWAAGQSMTRMRKVLNDFIHFIFNGLKR